MKIKMIKELREWWSNHKERILKEQNKRIESEAIEEYNVTEKRGNLYLVAGSRAIAKIERTTTVAEVIQMINEARIAQVDFKKNELR